MAPDSVFCTNCGMPLAAPTPTVPEETTILPTPPRPASVLDQPAAAPNPPAPATPPPPPAPLPPAPVPPTPAPLTPTPPAPPQPASVLGQPASPAPVPPAAPTPDTYPQQAAYPQQDAYPTTAYPPGAYQQQPYQQQPYHQPGAYPQAGAYPPGMYPPPPRQPSPLPGELAGALKGVFSADPAAATAATMDAKSPVWAVLGGAYAVIFAFTPALLIRSLLGTIYNAIGSTGFGGYASLYLPDLNQVFGQVFTYSLILGILSFFIWATGVFILFRSQQATVTYVQSMSLVSAALVPVTAGLVAGILFSFVWSPLAVLCISVGQFASSVLVYQGAQRSGRLAKPAFWTYILIYTGTILVTALCAYLLLRMVFF